VSLRVLQFAARRPSPVARRPSPVVGRSSNILARHLG